MIVFIHPQWSGKRRFFQMIKGRVIHQIDPANQSTLRIRILLALNASGKDCMKTPEEVEQKLFEKHGKKFHPFEVKEELSTLAKQHLIFQQEESFKLTSDARDQMEDLPNRCTKTQWDHIIGLATTGAFPVLHGLTYVPPRTHVRSSHVVAKTD